MKNKHIVVTALTLFTCVSSAFAHRDGAHAKAKPNKLSPDIHAWGQQGDPKNAVRTINIDMADTMRFSPDVLNVRLGETVKLVVRNTGKTIHELVLGSEDELKKHAELMKKFPNMEHDEPYMAHVKPGTTQTITWRFSKPGTFAFGCLLPGHWEAGMKGTIAVANFSTKS